MTAGAEFAFAPASLADLERLAALRVVAMRDSLEKIGRFDPERARRRMIEQYDPDHTRLIEVDGLLAGCVALIPMAGGLTLQHFYIDPARQGVGLGSSVLRAILAETDAHGDVVELTALRESRAQALYVRFGFIETGRDEVDVFYRRRPAAGA